MLGMLVVEFMMTEIDPIVKQALRRALMKYKLHTDQELFAKRYGYIREHY